MIRYNGVWYAIQPKPFEPRRQTLAIAWKQVRDGMTSERAYQDWYAEQRRISKLLYQSKKDERHD